MKEKGSTISESKTKLLISCAVTAQLICAFVFAYTNCWFSHAKARIIFNNEYVTPYGQLVTPYYTIWSSCVQDEH